MGIQEPSRSVFPRVVAALVVPGVFAAVFLPVFRLVQAHGLPPGSLEGIDLTPFARRDEHMMLAFGAILLLFVFAVCAGAKSGRHRFLVGVAATAAAFVSYGAVFVTLLAG
jgi:hypothetical protein